MKVVYILYSHIHQAIKIGYATDLGSRISAIQTSNPEKLSLMFTFEGGREVEKYLHERLKTFRINGEWFEYNDFVKDFLLKYQEHQFEFFTFRTDEKLKDNLHVSQNEFDASILDAANSFNRQFSIPELKKKLHFITISSKQLEAFILLNGFTFKQYGSSRKKYFYRDFH